jgi:hypothetical protein
LLTGVIGLVRAKVASSLNALCWTTPIRNCSVSTGNPSFLNALAADLFKIQTLLTTQLFHNYCVYNFTLSLYSPLLEVK